MPDVKSYDPADVNTIFASIHVQGFADGEMVSIKRDANLADDQVGAQGDVVVVKNRNPMADVTFRLSAESPTNARLSALAEQQGIGPAIIGKPFTLSLLNGTTLIHGTRAWIKTYPEVGYGAQRGVREWVIRVVCDVFNVGGAVV